MWESRYRYLEAELEAMMLGVADAMEKSARHRGRGGDLTGVRVVVERVQDSVTATFLTEGPHAYYWFELFHNDLLVDSTSRSLRNTHTWDVAPEGRYRVEAYAIPAGKPESTPICMSARVAQGVRS